MKCILALTILAFLAVSIEAKPQLGAVLGAFGFNKAEKCKDVTFKGKECAKLYDDENCDDDEYTVNDGEVKSLPLADQNHKESLVVRQGCSFRGYDDGKSLTSIFSGIGLASNNSEIRQNNSQIEVDGQIWQLKLIGFKQSLVKTLGERIEFSGKENENAWLNDLDDHKYNSDLDKNIEFVSCVCGNQGACPAVPPHLCGVAYDEPGCDIGDWKQAYEIGETNLVNLGGSIAKLFSDGVGNGIESVSVRKGCTMTLYDDEDLDSSDGSYTIVAPKDRDAHVTLKDNKDPKAARMNNDAESIRCQCA